ncbi:hypothetical protein MKY15_04625 [Sporosarcina sp. FSL K6-1540]|uniref:hypothetical protein n=1 Tax=Sporosarcina sp. FSL K6-1540 TaxID=2921555 RepID=UPI003159B543
MTTVTNVADFNTAIVQGVDALTISGDVATGSTFNLQGKTITNLTIDLTGMTNAETITLTNGSVKNLTIKDKTDVTLNVNNVVVENRTILN